MSFRDNLLEAMTARLEGKDYLSGFGPFELEDRKVVDFEEDVWFDGACDTCYFEYAVVRYEFDDGSTAVEETSFFGLMREL